MCFLSVRMFAWCDQVAGSGWGWFVLTGSEQNTDGGCWLLLLLLLSARQSWGSAGLWHIGCRGDEEQGLLCMGGQPTAAAACCLSSGTGAGAGWDGSTAEHLWVEEVRRATSKVSAAPQS